MAPKFANLFATEGTAALKPALAHSHEATATIIPFPIDAAAKSRRLRRHALSRVEDYVRSRICSMLAASEMFCSLLTEDVRGCSYGVFTKKGIIVLAVVTSLMATAAIAIGA